MRTVYVSVLNWNDAASTIHCLRSIQTSASPESTSVTLFVVDNGSRADDLDLLKLGLDGLAVELITLPRNVGFADGHNHIIQQAVERSIDFVWLVNNDAVAGADVLAGLLDAIEQDARVAVVSPMIYSSDEDARVDFAGAAFDWRGLTAVCAADAAQAKTLQARDPTGAFVYGTAPLIRVSALKEVGSFRGDLFAYFEDVELGARLSKRGWLSRMALDVSITHHKSRDLKAERKPYYFYLMSRNGLHFYVAHTPRPYRRLIRTRMLARGLILAALLRERGFPEKANATLIGLWDGLRGRLGPPRPDVKAPVCLALLSRVFPYRLMRWLG
jgi:GT2 family glycosyltransferase